ncbi:membrane biogenesis protein [Shinella sp. AETb1-6]|uniref:BtpA/SgcQ family protein n=1 Tax=Shinella sp. AETb1-6 TaxID=2692210 RepID=UPI00136EB6D3|nr:BtpA/SgcQ family protein [Shinella sp. AETb1-6]MXN52789.1 membrane biogenesis protein [Shinella sp. AETb1-6]
MNRLIETFATVKPILGMLHLAGDGPTAKLAQAEEEARIMAGEGVDGLVVENYFGDADDVERVLDRLSGLVLGAKIGVNVLRDNKRAFALAKQYPVSFIQVDSVAGHLPPENDAAFAADFAARRASVPSLLLGGVRFKYQPVLSGRSEEEDVRLGARRCDGLVVTSDATGQPTDMDKVARFRAAVGEAVPLLIGAGLTETNAAEQLAHADGAVVGSWFKHDHKDTGRVEAAHVARLMRAVRLARSAA